MDEEVCTTMFIKRIKQKSNLLGISNLRPSLIIEQVLNSLISFIMIREIISISTLTFISNLNTLIVLSYSTITIFRLYLQYAISTGTLHSSKALNKIFKSNLVRIMIVFVIVFIFIGLDKISNLAGILLFISMLAMDFSRYFCLFTNRVILSLMGNLLSILLGLTLLIWISRINTNSETLIYIWIFINWIFVITTFSLGVTSKYKNPSNIFVDKVFESNFKLIFLDSATIQFFQTLCSAGLLLLAPEANAAARIGSQVFLSVPNLLIASTAPFLALYVSKGFISYNIRFNLMLVQLFFYIVPISLIFFPPRILEIISGSSDRFYLVYQVGFIANGMSMLVVSSFSYGHINLVGTKVFLLYKIIALACTLLLPLVSMVLFGVTAFNLLSIVALCFLIFFSKRFIKDNS